MAYDERLAKRVDAALEKLNPPKLVDKKMFGGIGFMVQGNMACGVIDERLIVRVGKEAYEEALAKPGTRLFDITGRPMSGWVMVEAEVLESDAALAGWVEQGVRFALSLPPK
jgi:TfoX/Sxy family transcriptional regulator of competence genes